MAADGATTFERSLDESFDRYVEVKTFPGEGVTKVDDDETGFYFDDDGPEIPEQDRDRVFERGYPRREHAAEFGLAIEGSTDAHGWSVRVTEGRDARTSMEFETKTTD